MTRAEEEAAREYARFHWGREPERLRRGSTAAVTPSTVLTACGRLVRVAYETQKGHDGEPVVYVHDFEENLPWLCYTKSGKLVVVGGSYRVTRRGIVG